MTGASSELYEPPVDRRGLLESAENVKGIGLPKQRLENVRMVVPVCHSPDACSLSEQLDCLIRTPRVAQRAREIVETRRELGIVCSHYSASAIENSSMHLSRQVVQAKLKCRLRDPVQGLKGGSCILRDEALERVEEEWSGLAPVTLSKHTMSPIGIDDRSEPQIIAALRSGAREPLQQGSACHAVVLVKIDRGDYVDRRPKTSGLAT
jgi:hypothetical protein